MTVCFDSRNVSNLSFVKSPFISSCINYIYSGQLVLKYFRYYDNIQKTEYMLKREKKNLKVQMKK